ncbi:MAG TPA: 30S ribosomal protein S6e [Candidatus Woesearchaeota archaeon]|nr:30S ribosomal protein S6e [Candidatus Woesearchaeota archaeon]
MAEYKLVISDPKAKKAYQIEVKSPEADSVIGKRIGEKVKGDFIKAQGFELQITGGSDKQGFPMRADILGTKRLKILVRDGPGFKPTRPGMRKRKSLRGNQISDDISQINMKVVEWGSKPLGVVLGKEEEATPKSEVVAEAKKPTEETKESAT